MRTSRLSQETTRIFSTLSSNVAAGRATRSKRSLATYALGYDGTVEVKEEESASPSDDELPLTPATPDIEDVFTPVKSSSRKRKRELEVLASSSRYVKKEVEIKTEYLSPVKPLDDVSPASTPGKAKARKRVPARRATSPGGTVTVAPPADWEELYDTVAEMRRKNPVAPVDTMGCEDLFWQSAPPKEKRYHTLTALMLSSQTKDTVTAAAMQRLHTELLPQKPDSDGKMLSSSLTVENVIDCDPKHLDNLIGKVGFHNNKTKFIKQAAQILKDEYAGDIPDSIEGLVRLPGVGPKMAYLCMSAAWGIDVGIGVDVHVHRITNLWGWHNTKTPEETRASLESWLPKDKWHEINKMLVGLGQTVCLPIGRRCGECDVAGTGLCKAEVKGWKDNRKVKKEKVEILVKEELL